MSPSDATGRPGRPPWPERLVRWFAAPGRGGWTRLDALTAVATFVGLTLPALLGYPSREGSPAAVAVCGAGAALPLAVRRRWPLPVLVVVTSATVAGTVAGVRFTPFVSNAGPGIGLAMYTVAAHASRRTALAALAVTFTLTWVGTEVAADAHPDQDHNAVHSPLALAGWLAGDAVQVRRRYRTELAARRRAEADERARRAIAEERLRISREVHDVMSHSLGVIAVQAGVGRLVFDQRPDQAREALASVESLSRGALDELRHILGGLREPAPPGWTEEPDRASTPPRSAAAAAPVPEGAADDPLSPAPGLRDIPALVERLAAAGMDVALDIDLGTGAGAGAGTGGGATGTAARPPLLELCAYRIVQEALTNVVRHAPGASSRVTVRRRPHELVVEVLDDGGPGPGTIPPAVTPPPGGGWGITGMRERAALFGGTVVAEPRPDGGFRVVARLPTGRAPHDAGRDPGGGVGR